MSEIGYTLTQLDEMSVRAVLTIWNHETYNTCSVSVPPAITFPYKEEILIITPIVVCEALHIPISTLTAYQGLLPNNSPILMSLLRLLSTWGILRFLA